MTFADSRTYRPSPVVARTKRAGAPGRALRGPSSLPSAKLRASEKDDARHGSFVRPRRSPRSSAYDREALEYLCRYGARPAFAHVRLPGPDGRISYQLKRPWPDGRTHLVLEPVAFLRRLIGSSRRRGGVLACACGGGRTGTAFLVDTTLAHRLLTALGLAAEAATFAPARDPPQVEDELMAHMHIP